LKHPNRKTEENKFATNQNMQKEKERGSKKDWLFFALKAKRESMKQKLFSLRRKTGRLEAINFVISSLTCQVLPLAPALHEIIQRNITGIGVCPVFRKKKKGGNDNN
jgi:hypothetical protein